MSRKRLEELESKYSTITITSEQDGIEYTELDVKDLVFLIQNGFKQAERVQELNKENKRLEIKNINYFKDIETLVVQNKRYRERIAQLINYIEMTDDDVDQQIHKIHVILDKTLEGEE